MLKDSKEIIRKFAAKRAALEARLETINKQLATLHWQEMAALQENLSEHRAEIERMEKKRAQLVQAGRA